MQTEKIDFASRQKIREGSVLMIRSYPSKIHTSFITKAIRAITGSPYNHVAVVVKKNNILQVYEAVEKGFVNTMTLDTWLEREGLDFDMLIMNPPVPENFKEKVLEITGSPYDFGSLLFFQLIYQIGLKFKINLWFGKKGEKATGRIYCSEAIAYLFSKEKWWTWSPKDVYDAFYEYAIYETRKHETGKK